MVKTQFIKVFIKKSLVNVNKAQNKNKTNVKKKSNTIIPIGRNFGTALTEELHRSIWRTS